MAVLLTGHNASTRAAVRPWLWLNLISADAPLIAVVWQMWFARCSNIALAPLSITALAMTVWMIYAADRLLDVRRAGRTEFPSPRHRFHQEHSRALLLGVVLCLIVLFFTATRLNRALLRNGLALSVVVLLYFLAVHFLPKRIARFLPKELAVGVVFALGTALAPWSRLRDSDALITPVVLFALLCFLNCAAIEVWEWKGSQGLKLLCPHRLSLWMVRHLRVLASLIASASCILLIVSKGHPVFAAITVTALGFLWLDVERDRLSIAQLRVLADVPLLSPLLLLLGLR